MGTWHEERPMMRARVVTPDKAIHAFDRTHYRLPARDDNDKIMVKEGFFARPARDRAGVGC